VGFDAWLDHDLACLLDDPIPHGRHSQGSLPSVGLGDVDTQHRLRAVVPGPQVLRSRLKEGCDALTLHLCHAEAIDARAPPIRSSCLPGPPQHIGPVDAVGERMEPTVPAPVGRPVSPALEVS
jgi:hypothetical protein